MRENAANNDRQISAKLLFKFCSPDPPTPGNRRCMVMSAGTVNKVSPSNRDGCIFGIASITDKDYPLRVCPDLPEDIEVPNCD